MKTEPACGQIFCVCEPYLLFQEPDTPVSYCLIGLLYICEIPVPDILFVILILESGNPYLLKSSKMSSNSSFILLMN